ncbi:MAG: alpha/beta fold hydrolase [Xanthomonadales bacterium]|nr:alpha/beta fold hydrolase [Xanthomonadales bacterium]
MTFCWRSTHKVLALASSLVFSGMANAQGVDDHSSDPAYAPYYQQTLDWGTCPPSQFSDGTTIQCALVIVPVDWNDPGQGDITIGVSKPLAPPPHARLLLINGGGPDSSSAAMAEFITQWQPQFQVDHLVVGVDLRGISDGQGTRVSCEVAPRSGEENFMDGDSRNPTVGSLQAEQDWWNQSLQGCLQQHAAFLKGINTPNHVRDLNLVRALLGFDQADLFGVSSGTGLMAYASRLFPERFDRVVLDSNMNWLHLDWQRQSVQRMRMDQLNLQEAFIPFIARHNEQFGMGTSPAQVITSFQQIYQAASEHRMGSVTPDQALGSLQGTGMWFFWDFLVAPSLNAMAAALDGDPVHIAAAEQLAAMTYDDLRTRTSFNPMSDALQCNDSGSTDRRSVARKIADVHAYWAIGTSTLIDKCQQWPWSPVIDRHLETQTRVHALMVQNEFDPSTPYAGAFINRKVNGKAARMVLVDNAATHAVMFDNNACVLDVELAYLNDGVTPNRDVVCDAAPMHSFGMSDTETYEYGHRSVDLPIPPLSPHGDGQHGSCGHLAPLISGH